MCKFNKWWYLYYWIIDCWYWLDFCIYWINFTIKSLLLLSMPLVAGISSSKIIYYLGISRQICIETCVITLTLLEETSDIGIFNIEQLLHTFSQGYYNGSHWSWTNTICT